MINTAENIVTVQERVAGAIQSSDLTHVEHRMCDADTLRAIALSNPLGAALWHLKYANDAGAYDECLALLKRDMGLLLRKARGARSRLNRTLAGLVCEHVLKEWILDICSTCLGAQYGLKERRQGERREGGAMEVWDRRQADRRFICPACKGTNKATPSDAKRRQELGVTRDTYLTQWEPLYRDVLNLIVCADAKCDVHVRRRLSQFELLKIKLDGN